MITTEKGNEFRVLLSLVVALLLTIMPLPDLLVWLRPQWVLAIVLFWIITKPASYGVFFAWLCGLWMDLVAGTPFGQQAIIFVFVSYFVIKLRLIIVHSPRWQQAVIVGAFSGIAMVLQSILMGFVGHSAPLMRNELSVLSTVIIWPMLYYFLGDSQRSGARYW